MEQEPQINRETGPEDVEKIESPSFVDEFWERHGRPKENFWENKDGLSEFLLNVWLRDDLCRATRNLKWGEVFPDTKALAQGSHIICPDYKSQFKVLLTFGNDPKISISLMERQSPRLLEEFGEVSLSEQKRIIKSIDAKLKALGIHAQLPQIAEEVPLSKPEDPDTLPDLPPSAKKVSQKEVQSMNPMGVISHGLTRELQRALLWPEMGSEGHSTKYGVINGPLIYSDGLIAIFETPYGLIKIPFDELLDPSGVSYGDRKIKIKKRLKQEAQTRNDKNNRSQQQQEMRF